MLCIKLPLIVVLLFRLGLQSLAEDITTHVLIDPQREWDTSEAAVSLARDTSNNLYICVESLGADGSGKVSTVLYKTNPAGQVLWSYEATGVNGTPHKLVVSDAKAQAFVVLSLPFAESSPSSSALIRIDGISASAKSPIGNNFLQHQVLYSVGSAKVRARLFSCALDTESGDIMITGGANGPLFGASQGQSDVIVARLTPRGTLVAQIQVGTTDDEFGRDIDINSKHREAVVAAQRTSSRGEVDSVLYRFDAQTLVQIGEPLLVPRYGNGYDIPMSVAISPQEDGATVTFVGGDALVASERRTDMFVHVHVNIDGVESSVGAYIDGADDLNYQDFGTALQAGIDGNAYQVGYSVESDHEDTHSIFIAVVSPTGRVLYRTRKRTGMLSFEHPNALVALNNGDGLAFAGWTRTNRTGPRKGIVGFARLPSAKIPRFTGFGGTIEEAAAPESEPPTGARDSSSSSRSQVTVIAACAAVGAIVIVGCAAGIAAVVSRKRAQIAADAASAPRAGAASGSGHAVGRGGSQRAHAVGLV